MEQFDYIIIGAGSAGCTLANRLGEDRAKRILIVEAGPMDRNLLIHVPAGVYKAWREPKFNWNYDTEPEAELLNQQVFMPRGKVLGGSSSINSMVYMRGHPLDFDGWEQECGLPGWGYAHCLPYFKAGESYNRGGNAWRGGDGPLGTCKGDYENPLYDAFVQASEEAGQGYTDDPNGYQPEGVARLDATKRDGRRCSAAVAHLRPALARGNVSLITRAMVERIDIAQGRAQGITYRHRGALHQARASGEVILSGGALNSPHLLMLSGIGPAAHLKEHGIACLVDAPDVGQNLQDHASIILQFESRKHYPIHTVDRPWNKAMAGLRWVFTRDGIAASNIWEAGGLVRGNDHVAYPNLQYHMGPVGFEYVGNKITLSQAFAIHVDQLRPRSRGELRLRSANPGDKPLMQFNYLSDPHDLKELVEGVHKCRDLVAQGAFDALRGAEMIPGPHVKSDEEIAQWVRGVTTTDFHPSCTCRMGPDDRAVVDGECRVKGVEGLRVVDASVMPRITSANLNAPTQMIAARAADFIAGRPQRAPEYPGFAFEA